MEQWQDNNNRAKPSTVTVQLRPEQTPHILRQGRTLTFAVTGHPAWAPLLKACNSIHLTYYKVIPTSSTFKDQLVTDTSRNNHFLLSTLRNTRIHTVVK
jgi:hypothetical protein